MHSLDFERRVKHGTWLLDLNRYDRRACWLDEESLELKRFIHQLEDGRSVVQLRSLPGSLSRLYAPIRAALQVTRVNRAAHHKVLYLLLRQIHVVQSLYWGWSREEWLQFFNANPRLNTKDCQRLCGQHLISIAYLLVGFTAFQEINFYRSSAVVAARVFGRATLDEAAGRITAELVKSGYRGSAQAKILKRPIGAAMLLNGSSRLKDMTADLITTVYDACTIRDQRWAAAKLSYALFSLGIIDRSLLTGNDRKPTRSRIQEQDLLENVPEEWAGWCQRWFDTSTLGLRTRRGNYRMLLKVGRWLASEHPVITSPEQWTRELAIDYVAAVDRQCIGDWISQEPTAHVGNPLSARSKAHHLQAIRTFFCDCQAWAWLPSRFDPRRCFATPRSIKALIAPKPCVIADDVWAKLLWAGLGLTDDDLSTCGTAPASGQPYPLEMVRAVAVTWLFSGLRVDELRRLRVGCIRWQQHDLPLPGTNEVLSRDTVCFLDVPPNKSGPAFFKPVDTVVGEAIAAWEAIRPAAPVALDPKAGEEVHYLFDCRGTKLGVKYLNQTLIPLLCRKADVPREDMHGNITSHRARSTIASQLANAKKPMSLLELREWLGHKSVNTTLHYVRDNPMKLVQAYTDAGYFRRNVRMVEVLIDQEAIKAGATAHGEPWKFYDLGPGHCTYDFFDQCPHRMTCARCAFYCPKDSARAQLLEASENLQHMVQEIPLTDDEQLAVEDGLEAVEKLCIRLADRPTPAGPTPRQLGTFH